MKINYLFVIFIGLVFSQNSFANSPISSGKFKNWETFTINTNNGKICFAQTKPVKRSPTTFKREGSRLFVSFRPNENVKDEISITSGHEYKASTVTARS